MMEGVLEGLDEINQEQVQNQLNNSMYPWQIYLQGVWEWEACMYTYTTRFLLTGYVGLRGGSRICKKGGRDPKGEGAGWLI